MNEVVAIRDSYVSPYLHQSASVAVTATASVAALHGLSKFMQTAIC